MQKYWLLRAEQFIEEEPPGSKDEYSGDGYASGDYARLDVGSLPEAQSLPPASLPLAVFSLREEADAFANAINRATVPGNVYTSERFFSAQLLRALQDSLTDIKCVALDPAPELVAHAASAHAASKDDAAGLGAQMIALLTVDRKEFMDLLLGSLIHPAAIQRGGR